jgi:hypothetical protein
VSVDSEKEWVSKLIWTDRRGEERRGEERRGEERKGKESREIFRPCQESNHISSVVQSLPWSLY